MTHLHWPTTYHRGNYWKMLLHVEIWNNTFLSQDFIERKECFWKQRNHPWRDCNKCWKAQQQILGWYLATKLCQVDFWDHVYRIGFMGFARERYPPWIGWEKKKHFSVSGHYYVCTTLYHNDLLHIHCWLLSIIKWMRELGKPRIENRGQSPDVHFFILLFRIFLSKITKS